MMFRLVVFWSVLFVMFTILPAQDRKGNIVEYFGKETAESIHEGEVVHVFKEGLLLGGSRFQPEPGVLSNNPVFARILREGRSGIGEGKLEDTDLMGNKRLWEKIGVNDQNEFQNRQLGRSGYLFLEYESDNTEILLLEASGHTDALINGLPHEGDHYDYGWSLIPVTMHPGQNEFVLRAGRFPKLRARLLKPSRPVQFTARDMTLPDILVEDTRPYVGGIRVVNARDAWFKDGTVRCKIGDLEAESRVPAVAALHVRKIPFTIPAPVPVPEQEKLEAVLFLQDGKGNVLDTDTLELDVKSVYGHHKRTFISTIDGSVQYFSVAPCSDPEIENPALFLSVHGASVEAVNQARAYKQKEWGHLVAPTNRRPYGYAWENWGRIDALEVLDHAEKLFKTDPRRTYLTGHSMGGHGTWQLGATYPDRFAAIAPCAGYPDLEAYSQRYFDRLRTMSDEDARRWGIDRDKLIRVMDSLELKDESDIMLDSLMRRSGNPGRTLKLKRNYLHHGVFILHGEKDTVVPTEFARQMRATLGQFHPDFTYYEYPDGTHWYGDHSVDWPPIFEFFRERSIKPASELKKLEFYTASPGVSDGSHFIRIVQQEVPLEISSFNFNKEKGKVLTTENARLISIDLQEMSSGADTLLIDGQEFVFPADEAMICLKKAGDTWAPAHPPVPEEKGPHRNGGFKTAFTNNVVLVYASKGTKVENEWYLNRARYDAEKFYYLGNGSFEIVKDSDFSPARYKDRNVVLYGNRDNNAAWKKLLKDCPVQVSGNELKFGKTILKGGEWGSYFIYPRPDSDTASVGVVTATGESGMKAAFSNEYLGRAPFPDLLIFNAEMMENGIRGVKAAGFFGNEWSVENGDFAGRP